MESHAQGMSAAEIGTRNGFSHATADRIINAAGRVRLKPRLVMVGKKKAICSSCGECKPLEEFPVVRKPQRNEYRRVSCKDCLTAKRNDAINADILRYLRKKVRRIKSLCREKGYAFKVTAEQILKVYNDQNGCCFYTDTQMIFLVGDGQLDDTISVDRIRPDRGYVMSNIVLCARRANSIKSNMTLAEMKQWMPGWYERLKRAGKA